MALANEAMITFCETLHVPSFAYHNKTTMKQMWSVSLERTSMRIENSKLPTYSAKTLPFLSHLHLAEVRHRYRWQQRYELSSFRFVL